ncbi:MAG: hypothetical protein V3V04_06665 [Rhizobiaceae bacterium]
MSNSPNLTPKLNIALLLIRVTVAAFLGVWASLKFYHPEWMGNVFRGTYGLTWLKKDVGLEFLGMEFGFLDIAYAVGTLQLFIVLLFVLGIFRTPVYAMVTIIHATGVIGTTLSGALWNWTKFPNNLLWTSVATLGALLALFILRHHDGYTIDGMRNRNPNADGQDSFTPQP